MYTSLSNFQLLFFLFFYLIFPFSLWKTDNFNNDNSVIFFTSNRVSAVKSALYSMLTSAIPPLLARYEYFEALATEDILNVVCWFFFSLNSLSPVSFSIKSNCKIKCKIEGYTQRLISKLKAKSTIFVFGLFECVCVFEQNTNNFIIQISKKINCFV